MNNPFESRLNRQSTWWSNYVAEADDKRTRAMYSKLCAMLIICVVVTGFIARLAQ